MDPLQEQLARIGLQVVGRRGFVLGGGHAIELHGMGDRPSEDIDLFSAERGGPVAVADDLLDAYTRAGFTVTVELRTADLVQIEVTDAQGRGCKVDLGVFWRARAPVLLDVGPVLHPDDAVAGKMDALFNRWAPRDFLDVGTILASGRYTRQQLMSIAAEHNPGFSPEVFAESLSYLHRIPDREFAAYGASQEQITRMRHEFSSWRTACKQNAERHLFNPGPSISIDPGPLEKVVVAGSSPSARARRPRVQPRQGARRWRSSRATVVRLIPA